METHTPTLSFKFKAGIGTGKPVTTTIYARWSLNPTGHLLLFVHGFNGDGTGTWADLPGQLCLHKKVEGYDLVFFEYDSVTLSAAESANLLHTFLNDLLSERTAAMINESVVEYDRALRRPKSWSYNGVVFLGHSLGACVVRQALLDHISGGSHVRWNLSKKLVWFAPAHSGARLLRLLTAVSLGVSVDSFTVATFFAPVLDDLKRSSVFLTALCSETQRLGTSNPALGAPLTFWAHKDKVVINGNFPLDVRPYVVVNDVSHTSICKPTGYSGVVQRLLQEL